MDRKPSLFEMVLMLAGTAASVWIILPPQERYWLKLRIIRLGQQIAAAVASREGRAGMRAELAGRPGEAGRSYTAAAWWSGRRDDLGRALEAMKP